MKALPSTFRIDYQEDYSRRYGIHTEFGPSEHWYWRIEIWDVAHEKRLLSLDGYTSSLEEARAHVQAAIVRVLMGPERKDSE